MLLSSWRVGSRQGIWNVKTAARSCIHAGEVRQGCRHEVRNGLETCYRLGSLRRIGLLGKACIHQRYLLQPATWSAGIIPNLSYALSKPLSSIENAKTLLPEISGFLPADKSLVPLELSIRRVPVPTFFHALHERLREQPSFNCISPLRTTWMLSREEYRGSSQSVPHFLIGYLTFQQQQ